MQPGITRTTQSLKQSCNNLRDTTVILSFFTTIRWIRSRREVTMPKRVLITGTSTGFGRDAAERLARRGDQVFAAMRDVEERNAKHREALERLATQEGLRLRVLALDVTDQAS